MLKGVLVVVIVLLVICGIYVAYNRGTSSTAYNGEVVTSDHMNSGAVDVDGKPVEAVPTPSRTDAPGMVNGAPAPVAGAAPNYTPNSTPGYAPGSQAQITTTAPARPYPTPAGQQPLPVSDSIAPNPPNGLAFGGSGKFQWYRQGDLTWRVDSGNGASCIAFATLDEWRKPIVYTHGCGNA